MRKRDWWSEEETKQEREKKRELERGVSVERHWRSKESEIRRTMERERPRKRMRKW